MLYKVNEIINDIIHDYHVRKISVLINQNVLKVQSIVLHTEASANHFHSYTQKTGDVQGFQVRCWNSNLEFKTIQVVVQEHPEITFRSPDQHIWAAMNKYSTTVITVLGSPVMSYRYVSTCTAQKHSIWQQSWWQLCHSS